MFRIDVPPLSRSNGPARSANNIRISRQLLPSGLQDQQTLSTKNADPGNSRELTEVINYPL